VHCRLISHWRGLQQAALTVGETGWLDDCSPLLWLPLTCDHADESAWVFNIRSDLAGATPGKPTRVLCPRDM